MSRPGEARATRTLLLRFWREVLGPYRLEMLALAGLLVLVAALQLLTPLLTMRIVDTALVGATPASLGTACAWLLGLTVARFLVSWRHEAASLRLRETVIRDLQARMYRHLRQLPLAYHEAQRVGSLQSRLLSDVRATEGALLRPVVTAATSIVTFGAAASLLLWLDLRLGAALLTTLVAYLGLRVALNARMRRHSRDLQEGAAQASAAVTEALGAVRVLKGLGPETAIDRRCLDRFSALADRSVEVNRFAVASNVGGHLISGIAIALLVWLGLSGVQAGTMTMGKVAASLALLSYLWVPTQSLIVVELSLSKASGALERVFEILDTPAERQGGRPILKLESRLELRNVHFSFPGGAPVLEDLNLRVEVGERVALVGRSGAGKSTLLSLLLGLRSPQRGAVLVDGESVERLDLVSLRERIAVVERESVLFQGSILENLRLGAPEASLEEIREACRQAAAASFLESLPAGLETEIGERGVRLSGGQIQRLALARALLRRPSLLVLDEAVSGVDTETEALIQIAFERLPRSLTVLVVAHRLSSLRLAERVVVLEAGRIVEDGPPELLAAAGGLGTRLYQAQHGLATSPARASVALSLFEGGL